MISFFLYFRWSVKIVKYMICSVSSFWPPPTGGLRAICLTTGYVFDVHLKCSIPAKNFPEVEVKRRSQSVENYGTLYFLFCTPCVITIWIPIERLKKCTINLGCFLVNVFRNGEICIELKHFL